MRRIDLRLTLESDVAVSASGRTLGGGQTLDYIPGRAIWGALAGRLYRDDTVARDTVWRLIHAGGMRCYDAVLRDDRTGRRALPTPRSWHTKKYGDPGKVYDLSHAVPSDIQVDAVPAGWRGSDGAALRFSTRYAMRVAITDSGRAADGLLYGIETLPEGLQLAARIDVADADDAALIERLILTGPLHLGRSRNAELGRVAVAMQEPDERSVETAEQGDARTIRFLCRSRVALRDLQTGMPTLVPTGAQFGLPGWAYDKTRSHVRTTRFSPFNAKRRRPEIERQVIEQGSVVVFTSEGPAADIDALRGVVARGVGEHVHQGLGDVIIEPAFLDAPERTIPVGREIERSGYADAAPPSDALFQWASRRVAARSERARVESDARTAAKMFRKIPAGASQWGEVRRLAREARLLDDADGLSERLQAWLPAGVRGVTVWQTPLGETTAAAALVEFSRNGPAFIELLAADAQTEAARRNTSGEETS